MSTSSKNDTPSDDITGDNSKETADQIFIHSALQHLHVRDADRHAQEESIQWVLGAIGPSPIPATRVRIFSSHLTATIAAAASLLLGFLIWSALAPTPLTAHAALQRATDAVRAGGDRHYRVVRSFSTSADENVSSDLYLRWPDLFALRSRGPVGFFWAGHDGREYWVVPALTAAPVVVGADKDALDEYLTSPNLPFLTVDAVLQRMSDSYELTLIDDEEDLFEVSGVLSEPIALYPERLSLRANRISGVVSSLQLSWPRNDNRQHPHSITFELIDEDPRPHDFYGHDSHHESDRSVRRF